MRCYPFLKVLAFFDSHIFEPSRLNSLRNSGLRIDQVDRVLAVGRFAHLSLPPSRLTDLNHLPTLPHTVAILLLSGCKQTLTLNGATSPLATTVLAVPALVSELIPYVGTIPSRNNPTILKPREPARTQPQLPVAPRPRPAAQSAQTRG